MSNAVIYLRSATGNRAQVRQQERLCRDYLAERDLTDAAVAAHHGQPAPGLTVLLTAAASSGATEVVVSCLSRLGRAPLANTHNFDAHDEADLTIHVANSTLSDPVSDEYARDTAYLVVPGATQTLPNE